MRLWWTLLIGLSSWGWLIASPAGAQAAKQAQEGSKEPPRQGSRGAEPKAPTGGSDTASTKEPSKSTPGPAAASKGKEGAAAGGGSASTKASKPASDGSAKEPPRADAAKPPATTGDASAPQGRREGEAAAAKRAPGAAEGGKSKAASPSEGATDRPKAADGKPNAGVTPGPSAPVDGGTFVVRLRDLEQRIDELKEQIRRSHTRLSLLSDSILASGVGGARAEITFINDLSDVFRLDKLLVVLDGAVQYNKVDDGGGLSEQEQIPIFTGSIPPGDHTVQVLVKLRGHGYGVFSYLRGYHFDIKDSHSFTVTEGKTANLEIIVFEEGGMTTQVEERPRIRYAERIEASARDGAKSKRGAEAASKSSKPPAPKKSGAK